MSAVTAGSPHNSIARGRSSILHDRAASRPVLNFSISAVTAAEDRQKSRYHGSCYNPNLNARHGGAGFLFKQGWSALPRQAVHAGGVADADLGLFVDRRAGQDLPRLRKRRLAEPIM